MIFLHEAEALASFLEYDVPTDDDKMYVESIATALQNAYEKGREKAFKEAMAACKLVQIEEKKLNEYEPGLGSVEIIAGAIKCEDSIRALKEKR